MEDLGYLMLQIFLLLLLAEVLGKVLKRLGMPEMVGFILAGIIFVNITDVFPEIGDLLRFDIYDVEADDSHFLNVMGQLGLVFLLFGIGLETRLSELMDIGRTALVVSILGITVPFVGGFLSYFLFGDDTNTAIMVGTSIFAMSTVVSVEILRNLGVTDTKEGKLIIGVAIFSDILCLIILAINTAIVSPAREGALWMNIAIIAVFIVLALMFIHHTSRRAEKRNAILACLGMSDMSHSDLFVLAFILCLGFTAMSYAVGLSGIIGAFLAGMYFAEFERSTHIRDRFETLTKFLLPFFFVFVGLKMQVSLMSWNAAYMAAILVVVAVVARLAGGYAGCRLCRVNNRLSAFVASCMVARGDISVIVTTLAYTLGIFDTDLYAAIILTAVLTQMIAPPLINRAYAKLKAGDGECESLSTR